jgi:CrcB protein
MNYLLVFIGGGIGSVLRLIVAAIFGKTSLSLPWATFSSNIISCLIFASVLYIYKEKQFVPENYRHLILIGICGGLSTFSTFSYETFELLKQGMTAWALLNIAFSCIVCIGIFFAFAK